MHKDITDICAKVELLILFSNYNVHLKIRAYMLLGGQTLATIDVGFQ